MSATAWFGEFRHLHDKARKKDLNETDKRLYLQAREQFARALTAAQGMTLQSGESARQAFRVAQAMQIEFNLASGLVRSMTLDISRGGFSCVLAQAPDAKDAVGYSLRMPGGTDPIIGRARVVSAVKQPGRYRVSFVFEGMSEGDQERLEMALFDAALARIPG
ncbi:PilZ domain-containing protein [Myxococcaceae bacterium GXIMD 01537]